MIVQVQRDFYLSGLVCVPMLIVTIWCLNYIGRDDGLKVVEREPLHGR